MTETLGPIRMDSDAEGRSSGASKHARVDVAEGHIPGFEGFEADELRQGYKSPSRFSRLASSLIRMATSRTTITMLLALLIFAALFYGYWVIVR